MADDYSHLEHLIQDITSVDTARMTLRWALERLSVLDRANRELEEKLGSAQQSAVDAERRAREAEEAGRTRMRALEEQESFYKKLEQTVTLLAEGKADILGIVRKEADLERFRREAEEDYRRRLAELERSNRALMEEWTQRLIEAAPSDPRKVAEAMRLYEERRRSLEAAHQERLSGLEAAFRGKEEAFLERERGLEAGVQKKLESVETLRAELEARVEARLGELESAHAGLKTEALKEVEARRAALEREFEERRRQLEADNDKLQERLHEGYRLQADGWHKEQLRQAADLGRAWELERERLAEERKVLEERLKRALKRIGELAELLGAADSRGRDEVLRQLADAELAFQERLRDLERLKSQWRAEAEAEARRLEEDFASRKAELERREREL